MSFVLIYIMCINEHMEVPQAMFNQLPESGTKDPNQCIHLAHF